MQERIRGIHSPATEERSLPAWTQCERKSNPFSVPENLLGVRRTRGGTPHSAEFIPAAMLRDKIGSIRGRNKRDALTLLLRNVSE